MGVRVLARSSTEALISLATVRDRLLDGDTSKNDLLTSLIEEASSAMAGYLGVPFARQRYEATLPGRDGTRLVLPRYPVDPDSVTLTIDGTAETDFSVEDAAAGILYREYGWRANWLYPGEDPEPYIVVTFAAGYVLPDQVQTWASGLTDLAVGGWVRPTSPSLSPLLFEVTTAGDAGGSEPTWPSTGGDTVALGGGAIATARQAEELPKLIQNLAYVEVFNRYAATKRVPGLASQRVGDFEESYFATHTGEDLAPAVRAGLDRLRAVA